MEKNGPFSLFHLLLSPFCLFFGPSITSVPPIRLRRLYPSAQEMGREKGAQWKKGMRLPKKEEKKG